MSELKKINGPVNIVGELEATSLDINGNADISGVTLLGTTNVTSQRLQVNGYIDITDVSNTALRWYNGSTFRGGLGLDDWAHSGSSSDITMYISGDNSFHVSTNNVKRAEFNSTGLNVAATVAATTFSGDLNGTINTATTAATQSAGNNSTKVATTAYADAAVAALVDSAPANLNTLNELAEALNDDDDAIVTINTALGTKLPLAGGNMTGAINILTDNSSEAAMLKLEQDGTGDAVIDYVLTGTNLWRVGVDNNSADAFKWGIGSFGSYERMSLSTAGALTVVGGVTGTTLTGTGLDINGNADISGTTRFGNTVTIVGTNSTNAESVLLRGIAGTDLLGSIRTANTGGYNQEMRFYTSNASGASDEDLTLTLKPDQSATFAGNIAVSGTVDGIDIATRDAILTSTTTTANAALPKAGGTMSGAIAMGNQNITGGGTITGTTLTGTGLDINGAADISGVLSGGKVFPRGVYLGTTTTGFLIQTSITTNAYAMMHGTIKLEQFNSNSFQTIEFSATTLSNGTVGTKAGVANIAVTIKLFNYNGVWYIWVPTPSTYTTCTAYIGLANAYQGQAEPFNEVLAVTNSAVPSSGVSNSVDLVTLVKATTDSDMSGNTTGSAATLTQPRAINGVEFDGSGEITITAAAGTLTGNTLKSTVVTSSLTSVGTIGTGVWNGDEITTEYTAAKVSSIVAGAGIDVNNSGVGDVTVTAETASATNPGIVELATTAEASTGTDTTRAVTAAGLAAHVESRKVHELTAPTAALAMNSQKVTGVANPTAAQDAATKAYTDAKEWNWNDITAGTPPTFNQNTTGSAEALRVPRAIYGNNFDGSEAVTGTIATAYIANDAITEDKLANTLLAEIDANTTKNTSPNIYGEYIKLLPNDFETNGDGGNTKFGAAFNKTAGQADYGMRTSDSNQELFTFVTIPQGYKATHVEIYGRRAKSVEVFEVQINATTIVSKGTGTCAVPGGSSQEFAITNVSSTATNLLAIEVVTTAASGDRVYGGRVKIATI